MKRQIRVMFYKLGYEVKRLLRIRIGGLQLSKLAPGEWRALRAREIALLTAGDKKKS
jgi:16S rRNA U516 pseudouridylate synthase RsuA-like enzyme